MPGTTATIGVGGMDPVTAIANGVGSIFNFGSTIFGAKATIATANANQNIAQQQVNAQSLKNEGDLVNAAMQLKAIKEEENLTQLQAQASAQAKMGGFSPIQITMFAFGGIALLVVGTVVIMKMSKNKS